MNKILFIDSVTTGMNPEKCAIYRIGGIFTVNGRETVRFELRMRPFPNARISDQSLWICKETRSSLIYYPDQAEAFADFIKLLNAQVNLHNPKDKIFIAGFNCDRFEYAFINEWFRRNGNERFRDYFYVQTIDLMTLANFRFIEKRHQFHDFFLETAARQLGVPVPGDDRYDCITNSKTCLDMYRKLAMEWAVADIEESKPATEIFKNFNR